MPDYPCVRCGYCCTKGACLYGRYDAAAGRCAYLTFDGPLATCRIWAGIVAQELESRYPMIDCGCSSRIGNNTRSRLVCDLPWRIVYQTKGATNDEMSSDRE